MFIHLYILIVCIFICGCLCCRLGCFNRGTWIWPEVWAVSETMSMLSCPVVWWRKHLRHGFIWKESWERFMEVGFIVVSVMLRVAWVAWVDFMLLTLCDWRNIWICWFCVSTFYVFSFKNTLGSNYIIWNVSFSFDILWRVWHILDFIIQNWLKLFWII